jgi:hypothetical protein
MHMGETPPSLPRDMPDPTTRRVDVQSVICIQSPVRYRIHLASVAHHRFITSSLVTLHVGSTKGGEWGMSIRIDERFDNISQPPCPYTQLLSV